MSNEAEMIYLVDDDERVRESLLDFFASRNMSALGFASAGAFLAHARRDAAACILLDLELPDMHGLELQTQLPLETRPPIIIISGHGDIPSTVRAMKSGAVEFLTKPVDPPTLVNAIRAAWATDRSARRQHAEVTLLQGRLSLLTPREREVLPLIVAGLLNKQAAGKLGISEITIQVHRGQIMKKMAADSFADLVRMAGKLRIPLPPATP